MIVLYLASHRVLPKLGMSGYLLATSLSYKRSMTYEGTKIYSWDDRDIHFLIAHSIDEMQL